MVYSMKRTLVLGLILISITGFVWANGQTESNSIEIHMGATSSPEHSYFKGADVFLEEIEKSPDMNFIAYREFGGVHGSDGDITQKVMRGELQAGIVCDIGISTIIPSVGFVNLPGLFTSYDDVDSKFINGWMGEEFRKMCDEKGLLILAFGENDFRAITNSTRPIRSGADLNGIKLRVPPTPMYQSFYQALGCLPANIAITELAMALQQKVVDGQDNGAIVTNSYGFAEFQSYMTNAKHMYSGAMFIFNKKLFESMTVEQQDFIKNAAVATMKSQVEINRADVSTYLKQMENMGMEIIDATPQLKADILEASIKVWNDPKLEKQYGKEILDRIKAEAK